MALTDIWSIVAAALLSVGGAGVIIVALSGPSASASLSSGWRA